MNSIFKSEWFEPIPDTWSVQRMKNIMTPKEGRSSDGNEKLLSVTIQNGVVKRSQYLDDDDGGSRADSLVGYKIVHRDDLVNNIMKMSFRCLGVSPYDGIVSPAYSVFEINREKVDPNYLNYQLRIDRYVYEYRKLSKGIQESRMRLYDDYFLSMKVIVPSIEEQKLISHYLDNKTNQIDSLVQKIQKKIELLKEQRTSLINHYVTKGLDPNVEMKDSGVEWVGDTPSNWDIISTKRLFKTYFGGSWGDETEDNQVENIVKVVRVTEFDMNYLEVTKEIPTLRSLELSNESPKLLKNGDLILEKSGGGEKTPVGRVVLYHNPNSERVVNSNFTNVCRPNIELVDPHFLVFLLSSLYSGGATVRNIKQTTGIQNLDLDGFMSEKVSLPPLQEQKEISSRIIVSNKFLQNLIQKNFDKISLLTEYRQSLISSVVTGKVRVTEDMI
jgi:type I restriction enzyme S subunit